MRPHRVQITRKRNPRLRAVRSKEGVKWFRYSAEGRGAKEEAKWRAYERQKGICLKCGQKVPLGDLVFDVRKFESMDELSLVHRDEKLCKKLCAN